MRNKLSLMFLCVLLWLGTSVVAMTDSNKAQTAGDYLQLARQQRQSNQLDAVVTSLQKAIDLDPKLLPAYVGLGSTLGELGKYPEAILTLKKAIALDPKFISAYGNLGMVYGMQGNYEEGLRVLDEALKINPEAWEVLAHKGVIYAKTNQWQKAKEVYQKWVVLDPHSISAHYNLGATYMILGEEKLARAEYKFLKQQDARNADKLLSVILQKDKLDKLRSEGKIN